MLGGELSGERLRGARIPTPARSPALPHRRSPARRFHTSSSSARSAAFRALPARRRDRVGQLFVGDRVVAHQQLALVLKRARQVVRRRGRPERGRVGLVVEHHHEHVLDGRQLRRGGPFAAAAARGAFAATRGARGARGTRRAGRGLRLGLAVEGAPAGVEDSGSVEALGVASGSEAGGEDFAAPLAAGAAAPAPGRRAPRGDGGGARSEPFATAPIATPKPRNATSSSAHICAGRSNTRAQLLRACSLPGPAPSARSCPSLRSTSASSASRSCSSAARLISTSLRKWSRTAISYASPPRIPVQLRHLRGQLLAAAFERGYIAHLAGRDDVRQVFGLLLIALPATAALVFDDARRRRFAQR